MTLSFFSEKKLLLKAQFFLCTNHIILQMSETLMKPSDSTEASVVPQQEKTKRIFFSHEDDEELLELVRLYGNTEHWKIIAKEIAGGKKFNSRQCRERYTNYLNGWNRNCFTPQEDNLLRVQVQKYGPLWSLIKNSFVNRSAVSLKNRWAHLDRAHMRRRNAHCTPIIFKILDKVEEPQDFVFDYTDDIDKILSQFDNFEIGF